ncbi:MAG TPA: hypothetical protein VMV81_12635 [Phycisphaerae bacterium]|nr:hypothetical protein [Phycisphaerae bacterium]
MKMPNFRLSETQATASVVFGTLAIAALIVLSAVVLKNFNTQTWTILFKETSTFGKYRKILVFLFATVSAMLGVAAVTMGFKTLGHKRNTKQSRSFLGMAAGGVALALAPVLLFMWIMRAEAIIIKVD